MARGRSPMLLRMTNASSIRRRVAGASILVAAVAGCAGTPSALAGTTPTSKAIAPPGALDSATAKRLNELEQAAALRCVGMPGEEIDPKACAAQQPGSQVQTGGGGAPSLGGPARDGGGIIDVDALGCRGAQGPVRPGETASDIDFDGISTEELRRRSQEQRANAVAERQMADELRKQAEPKDDSRDVNVRIDAFRDRFEAIRWEHAAERDDAEATKIDYEIRRREAAERNRPNSSPNARRPVGRTPLPGEGRGPAAVACATMEKAGFKTPEELKQANTPALQNVCADPAKDGGEQTGLQVDCGAAVPNADDCASAPTPTCVERTSPLANVRKIPGLTIEVPGVATGCAGRRDADCG
jgi:hypothetical protein